MLDVFFTVDVEVWCGGWDDLDRKFPEAFRRYIYGPTRHGHYGLPHHLKVLRSHGLKGVFFLESLFTSRFGLDPLSEIVSLIGSPDQEVQLHAHPEWLTVSMPQLLHRAVTRPAHFHHFSLEEQRILIATGRKSLQEAGAQSPNAFRAGSFALNSDTLRALAANSIPFDSSYNASMFGQNSGILPNGLIVEPVAIDGVYEYPMTVFDDRVRGLRHAQITACSYGELESLLWGALHAERKAFVLLSHSFELLNGQRTRPDWVAVRRFERLCAFLDRNRDCFRVRGFHDLQPIVASKQPAPLSSTPGRSGMRMIEQLIRRVYG